MDKPIEFRRKGRGYNKDDVNDFISRENIRFNKLEESYNKMIKDLEKEIADLKSKLNDNEADKTRIIELEIKISDLQEKLESNRNLLSEKDAIIDGLKSAVDNANEKLNIANSMVDDLKQKAAVPSPAPVSAPNPNPVSTFRTYDDSIVEKAEKYDSICNKVDEILAFAKEEADKIIAEAFEIRKQTIKRSSTQMKNDISERSESIIDELKRSIRRQLKK